MPHLNFLDFFNKYFEEFYRGEGIANSPSFGLCYRGRNSKYLQTEDYSKNLRKTTPIIHKLSSQEEDLSDLKFLSNLDSRLKRVLSFESVGKYNLETGLITIPLDQSNQSEESKNDLPNLIYGFGAITKGYYEKALSKIREKRTMDNIVTSLVFWGIKNIKNEKDLIEIIFNYYPEESPNELLRIIQGKGLEDFIREHTMENF